MRAAHLIAQPGNHQRGFAERLERLEDPREFKIRAHRGGHPVVEIGTVGKIDETGAAGRCGRRLRQGRQRRNHGFKEWQSDDRPRAFEKSAPRQKCFPEHHCALLCELQRRSTDATSDAAVARNLFWNGTLRTISRINAENR